VGHRRAASPACCCWAAVRDGVYGICRRVLPR
jgi:hypothetical protein